MSTRDQNQSSLESTPRSHLNQSQGGIYMVGLLEDGIDDRGEGVSLSLEGPSAATLDLVRPLGDVAEESVDVVLDLGFGAETGVGGHLLADPAPDGFIRVEVWAVGGQTNQAELQTWGGQVRAHGVAAVSRAIVPDHDQGLRVVGAQLGEEGDGGLGAARAVERHRFDLAGLQTDGRVVAGLLAVARAGRVDQGRLALQDPFSAQIDIGVEVGLVGEEDLRPGRRRRGPQERILAHELRPTHRVGLQQPFLGLLEHEAQAMQVVQAATPTERQVEALPDELPHDLPVPVAQVDPDCPWRRLDCRLYLSLLPLVEGGGEPPLCSKVRPTGPRSRRTASHSPIVCASRSSASATRAADQPRATSQTACHRSRSRAVGAWYIRSRTWYSSSFQASSQSSIAAPRGSLRFRQAYRVHPAGFTLALV